MNREDIIRMAREAGFTEGDCAVFGDLIAHFGFLVAAAEREECDKELTAAMARERAVSRQAIRSENKLKEIENYYLLYKDDDMDAEKALQRISEVIYETDYLFSRGQDGLR